MNKLKEYKYKAVYEIFKALDSSDLIRVDDIVCSNIQNLMDYIEEMFPELSDLSISDRLSGKGDARFSALGAPFPDERSAC